MLELNVRGVRMVLMLGAFIARVFPAVLPAVIAAGCGETIYRVGTESPLWPPDEELQHAVPSRAPARARVPERIPVVEVRGDEIKINDSVNFANNSAEIESSSYQLVEQIGNVMKDHMDIDFVEIAGHASRIGDAVYNQTLTQRRATAVMNGLIEQGIEHTRMRARGYGFYCELKPGDDDANRRVEIKILRRAGKDTSVKGGGCEEADSKGLVADPVPKTAPSTL